MTADTLAQHHLDATPAPQELQELVRTYNLMLRRLSTAWEQQKRFVNDLSHELRTPPECGAGLPRTALYAGGRT